MLGVATTPWAHGADAAFAMLEVVRAHGVPVAAFELRLGIAHPLLSHGSAVWTRERGGVWVVQVGDQRIVEQRSQREAGDNPLYADTRELRSGLDPVDLLDAALVARVRDIDRPLEEPVRTSLPGWAEACVAGVEYGAPQRSVLVFATDDPAGFTDAHLRVLHTAAWGMNATSRGIRWRALCHILARVYIGPQTGPRVLNGHLQRGDLERRHAVVWFSDVRGFTAMSVELAPEAVVERLNVVFEHVGRAVVREGGEILKFIGDGVLAVFPYASEADAADASRRARRAAVECLARLPSEVAIGIGLHRGELAYGNIGASDRLDFTVIGATVNLASRIEGLSGRVGESLLASEAVAGCEPDAWRPVGEHALKGVPGLTRVYAASGVG